MLKNPHTYCFVWNNILKFGKECEKSSSEFYAIELGNMYFNVITDEMSILNSDVCIFLTGPSYDAKIKSKFPDVELSGYGPGYA